MPVTVVLNAQQLEMAERIRAELGLASVADALRLGLREYVARQGDAP